jgi:serine/threonine protein kinase
MIGTIHVNRGVVDIYIDSFKLMRLQTFNDSKFYLIYNYLGDSLKDVIENAKDSTKIPSFEQRVFLCIDLIRQVNDLIKLGIYHTDLKSSNICILQKDDYYFLTIIDYGLNKTKNQLNQYYLTDTKSTTTGNNMRYSLEFYAIEQLEATNFYLNRELKVPFGLLQELFEKSLYSILGGLCIEILLFTPILETVFAKYMFHESPYIVHKLNAYLTELREILLGVKLETNNLLYNKLKIVILNLLSMWTYNKRNIQNLYDDLNTEPYITYFEARKSFKIDD